MLAGVSDGTSVMPYGRPRGSASTMPAEERRGTKLDCMAHAYDSRRTPTMATAAAGSASPPAAVAPSAARALAARVSADTMS